MRLSIALALILAASLSVPAPRQNPFLGAWNLTGTGEDTANVYWLEIKEENGRLSAMFLNRSGSPFALESVTVTGNELVFTQGGRGRAPIEFRARLENGRLVGRHMQPVPGAAGAAPTSRPISWVGVRPPAWPPSNANGAHTFGRPVVLFDAATGGSLDAWGVQHADRPMNWTIAEGLLTNQDRANNLVSKATFTDFKMEAEYRLGNKSNSGLYLRGRYELQLLDDATDTTTRRDLTHMALYGRTAPSTNASKPAGEWQTMTATVVGNRLTVVLNGQTVHDNAVILGITGGALDNNELAPGPIMIQGDHSRVWFRRVVVNPISRAGR